MITLFIADMFSNRKLSLLEYYPYFQGMVLRRETYFVRLCGLDRAQNTISVYASIKVKPEGGNPGHMWGI